MKLGREVKNSTKKMEMQTTGNIKCSQRQKKKKKDKIRSYLQKTLKAYRDRIKQLCYIMIILPGMRKMLLCIGTECSTCI